MSNKLRYKVSAVKKKDKYSVVVLKIEEDCKTIGEAKEWIELCTNDGYEVALTDFTNGSVEIFHPVK